MSNTTVSGILAVAALITMVLILIWVIIGVVGVILEDMGFYSLLKCFREYMCSTKVLMSAILIWLIILLAIALNLCYLLYKTF